VRTKLSRVQHFTSTHLYLERHARNMCKVFFKGKFMCAQCFLVCAHLRTCVLARTCAELSGNIGQDYKSWFVKWALRAAAYRMQVQTFPEYYIQKRNWLNVQMRLMISQVFYYICDTGTQNPLLVVFGFFYFTIFYTASASKYLLQNQNILSLTEVTLIWLEQSKNWKIE